MNTKFVRIFSACAVTSALLSGCASHPGPIIDQKGVNMSAYKNDLEECQRYASGISVAKGAAKGGALGAAVGAAAGAISGDVGRGAGYGAASGATRSGIQNKRTQENVVKRCLSGRGYKVLN